jgi:hypothetical protein
VGLSVSVAVVAESSCAALATTEPPSELVIERVNEVRKKRIAPKVVIRARKLPAPLAPKI